MEIVRTMIQCSKIKRKKNALILIMLIVIIADSWFCNLSKHRLEIKLRESESEVRVAAAAAKSALQILENHYDVNDETLKNIEDRKSEKERKSGDGILNFDANENRESQSEDGGRETGLNQNEPIKYEDRVAQSIANQIEVIKSKDSSVPTVANPDETIKSQHGVSEPISNPNEPNNSEARTFDNPNETIKLDKRASKPVANFNRVLKSPNLVSKPPYEESKSKPTLRKPINKSIKSNQAKKIVKNQSITAEDLLSNKVSKVISPNFNEHKKSQKLLKTEKNSANINKNMHNITKHKTKTEYSTSASRFSKLIQTNKIGKSNILKTEKPSSVLKLEKSKTNEQNDKKQKNTTKNKDGKLKGTRVDKNSNETMKSFSEKVKKWEKGKRKESDGLKGGKGEGRIEFEGGTKEDVKNMKENERENIMEIRKENEKENRKEIKKENVRKNITEIRKENEKKNIKEIRKEKDKEKQKEMIKEIEKNQNKRKETNKSKEKVDKKKKEDDKNKEKETSKKKENERSKKKEKAPLQEPEIDLEEEEEEEEGAPVQMPRSFLARESDFFCPRRRVNETAPLKVVLFWTPYWRRTFTFGIGEGRQPLINARCRENRCTLTNDKRLWRRADALVFHNANLTKPVLTSNPMPPSRLPHQKWIIADWEAPYISSNNPVDADRVYNWTMSYRTNSDVFSPVGMTYRRETPGEVGVIRPRPHQTRVVAWIASHCPTINGREDFVKFLSKFVKVDVFGKCGRLKCEKGKEQECLAPYKFYLAMENSDCRDYVTEKFWRTLNSTDAVPIVMSEQHAHLAPPNSYILASNFSSPKGLARHLLRLHRNDAEYAKLHSWRRTHGVLMNTQFPVGVCNLCAALHDPAKMRQASRRYPFRPEVECSFKRWSFYNHKPVVGPLG